MQKKYLVLIGLSVLFILTALIVSHLYLQSQPRVDTRDQLDQEIKKEQINKNTTRFTHPRYGFIIDVPNTIGVERYKEGNASETDIFRPIDQDATSTQSFQIFVTPYAEKTITLERLHTDISNGDIREASEVVTGVGKSIHAEIFKSSDPSMGEMREVWLIHNGFIYEFTTSIINDEWLAQILATLQFQDQ